MFDFAKRRTFHTIISVAIILCSITLGVETFYPEQQGVFDVLDIVFTTFFTIEIVIRLLAEKNPLQFFKLFSFQHKKIIVNEDGVWNWFDFTIVVVSIISLSAHLFEHPEFLVVSRLFRVLRVLRLLEVSSELKAVERKIVSIVPTIFSFALLLGILLYIYSIIGIYLFSHHKYQNADFTTLGHAFITLFQLMTLDGWSDMMYASSANYNDSWLIKSYFISFVVFTAIVSFNVFVAVLTSQVHEKLMADHKTNKNQITQLEGEVVGTGEEVQAGLREVLSELKQLRVEVKVLQDRMEGKKG